MTVISFFVNVPVLSEHTYDVAPNVSTLLRDLIKPLFLAILLAPIVNTIDKTAGKASGIEATAKAIAVDKTLPTAEKVKTPVAW